MQDVEYQIQHLYLDWTHLMKKGKLFGAVKWNEFQIKTNFTGSGYLKINQ